VRFRRYRRYTGCMHTQLRQADPSGFLPGHLYPATLLSERDRDVIALVLAGHTNAEIARRLNLQLQTLKNALSGIYDKLGVETRLQLVVLLLRESVSCTAGNAGYPARPFARPAKDRRRPGGLD
jgi:DNA-binding CsgD family transcriptional regulator